MTLPLPWDFRSEKPDGDKLQDVFDQIAMQLPATGGSSGTKKLKIPVNYVIGGAVDATTVVPQVPVLLSTGQSASIVGVYGHLTSGTSIAVQVRRNGSNVGSAVTVTTTGGVTARSQALSDGDVLDLVLSSPVGSPKDLTFSIVVEHTA